MCFTVNTVSTYDTPFPLLLRPHLIIDGQLCPGNDNSSLAEKRKSKKAQDKSRASLHKHETFFCYIYIAF